MAREGREHGKNAHDNKAFRFLFLFINNLNRQNKNSFSFPLDKSLDKIALFYFQVVILLIDMKKVFK